LLTDVVSFVLFCAAAIHVYRALPFPFQCGFTILLTGFLGRRAYRLWRDHLPAALRNHAFPLCSKLFPPKLLLLSVSALLAWAAAWMSPAIAGSDVLVACPTLSSKQLGIATLATVAPGAGRVKTWCTHEMAQMVLQQNSREFPLSFDHPHYLTELCIYSHRLPVRDTLIVTGPRHSGKTFGVQQLESYWRQQRGRTVLTLDLKTLDGLGLDDKMDAFQGLWQDVNAQLRTLLRLHFTANQQAAYHKCQPRRSALVPPPPMAHGAHFGDWVEQRDAAYAAESEELQLTLFDRLQDVNSFTGESENSRCRIPRGVAVRGADILLCRLSLRPELLRVLDWFARLGGGQFSPILIVRDVQQLGYLGSRLPELLSTLTARKQRQSAVPVILETSDSWWLAHEERLHSRSEASRELAESRVLSAVRTSEPEGDHPSFTVYYVDMMDYNEVRRHVVERWQLLSPRTFERVWNYSGGFGMAFSRVMDVLHSQTAEGAAADAAAATTYTSTEEQDDADVAEQINTLQQQYFLEFKRSLDAARQCSRPGCERAQLAVLRPLVQSAAHSDPQRQWRLEYDRLQAEQQVAVRELVRHNILYVRPCQLDGHHELCVEPACFTWRAQLVRALAKLELAAWAAPTRDGGE